MAEIVTGAMGTLLPKLANLIKEEYNLQRGVRGEIMFLKAEMESMETALLKVSEAPIDQPPDIQVKLWAKAVRDLSYDLEDNIDKFIVRIETHGEDKCHSFKGFIDKSLSLLTKGKIRHKIGIDIKDIKSRIKEVSERRDRYKVDSVAAAKPPGPSVDTLRLSALYRNATELVGTAEKSLEVVKMLMEGDEVSKKQHKVVSIVGFGGLGKTTLANTVYQNLKVQFDCAAFVSVSLNANMEKIFKSLLHQFDMYTYQNINEASWGEAQLIREIRTFLGDKRYLIVIDDIWDKSVWENIKYAFTENEHGSRVITTTRILDVAREADSVYRLEPLSVVDSRKLFHHRIYETENKSPRSHLLEISENILKRCGGVPLAILTIGSLLSSKKEKARTHEYWSQVYKSMGSGLDNNHYDVKNMRKILSVSYSDLSPHLKTCLLHLSLYPEDYVIETQNLIWKWVGEGFVKKEQGRSLYEVGEDYLDELINKSLVQSVHFDKLNKVSFCRIHDMIRDLVTSLSNEENFLTAVGGQQPLHLPTKIRRLNVQTSIEDVANQLLATSLSHVRSLTVSSSAFNFLPALLGFPILRVLDLTDCQQVDNEHWKDICRQLHLRYLSLKGTSITKIPKQIGNLQFLQVLNIGSTIVEEELPSTFIQLTQLLFLCIRIKTLGEQDLHVLGNIPSLSELYIQVEKPTHGRDKRLVIDSDHPFVCLTRFKVKSDSMELRFAQGAMKSLETLELDFEYVQYTMLQFGDFIWGLENLSSLEHISVKFSNADETEEDMLNARNAIEKEINMNVNKPKLNFSLTLTGKLRSTALLMERVHRIQGRWTEKYRSWWEEILKSYRQSMLELQKKIRGEKQVVSEDYGAERAFISQSQLCSGAERAPISMCQLVPLLTRIMGLIRGNEVTSTESEREASGVERQELISQLNSLVMGLRKEAASRGSERAVSGAERALTSHSQLVSLLIRLVELSGGYEATSTESEREASRAEKRELMSQLAPLLIRIKKEASRQLDITSGLS